MSDHGIAFPDRPLTAKPPGHGVGATIFALFGVVLLFGGGLLITIQPIHDLLADWQVLETARPVADGRIENGKCTTHGGVLVSCSGTLIAGGRGTPEVRQDVNDYFVDFHFGDYSAEVMADPAVPGHLTTDLALSKFWNRVATYAVSVPLVPALGIGSIFYARNTWRDGMATRSALRNKVLQLAPLRVEACGQKAWQVVGAGPDGQAVRRKWSVPARTKPIVVDAGRALILGVTADGTVTMPLDLKLKWLDLTRAERDAMQRSLPPQPAKWP
ncbi:hypothetical protein [Zavarzinia sp.]|uniref:hypothetical protein n=1 Tax=Zavarzinia sp. TaxID=2027920 RepID=UPI003562971C